MTNLSPETAEELMLKHRETAGYLPRLTTTDRSTAPMAENKKPMTIIATHGTVGKDPVRKNPKPDVNLVELRLAVTTSYEKDVESDWFQVSIWNEGLMDSVMAEVAKGTKIAVEGAYEAREYEGKIYHGIKAYRVGLIDWLARSERAHGSSAPIGTVPGQPVLTDRAIPAADKLVDVAAANDDDLPF